MKIPAIGSKVRVKTSYEIGRKMIPPQSDFRVFEGTVLQRDKWLKPNQFNLSSTEKNYPIRTIDINQVLEIEMIDGEFVALQSSTKTFEIAGSKGNRYTVTRENNKWSCTCPSFSFRKTCKHISEIAEREKA